MQTAVCEMFGIDVPLFAFSHYRDVVAAVSRAGGFGVLGASSHTPEQLEAELAWIDDNVDGKPYGADIVTPENLAGRGEHLDAEAMAARVPSEHRKFVVELLAQNGVEITPDELRRDTVGAGEGVGEKLLEVAMRHPIRLIANALGVPPQYMLDAAKNAGIPVAALVGAKEHAVKHVQAGADIIIAQGTEAGGHCGEVTTMVLVPEVVDAIAAIRPVPVLAAGGIVTGRQMAAAIALGAAGAWTGSVWLTTNEAETAPHTVTKLLRATSRDTVRSRARTGKYSRQLRSAWTDAWTGPDAPDPLPMPLQSIISEPALRRVDVLAEKGQPGAQDMATYWVGQGVGLMNKAKPARQVVVDMVEDYLDAVQRLTSSIDE
jgi:NAD(P)H-dependent flavin oxidoreductase YrpB (nitropropane dioxygenase family)